MMNGEENDNNIISIKDINEINDVNEVVEYLGEVINSVNTMTMLLIIIFHRFFDLGGIKDSEFESWKELFKHLKINDKDSKFAYKIKKVVEIEIKLDLEPGEAPWTMLAEIPLKRCHKVWDEAKSNTSRKFPTAKKVKQAIESIKSFEDIPDIDKGDESSKKPTNKDKWDINEYFHKLAEKCKRQEERNYVRRTLNGPKNLYKYCAIIFKNESGDTEHLGDKFKAYYQEQYKNK